MLIKKLFSSLGMVPKKAHITDAGFDLFSSENYKLCGMMGLIKNQSFLNVESSLHTFHTDFGTNIPPGHAGFIWDKSGLGAKGVKVFGGVIDSGYTGEIMVTLGNFGMEDIHIAVGFKLAQLVIMPVSLLTFDSIEERRDKGFGSTGAY